MLGATTGPVTVRADSTGLPSVTFNLAVIDPPIVAPVISAVVGGAQSVPPVTTVSKNANALIFLGTPPVNPVIEPVPTPYPTNVANTCVTIEESPSPSDS